MNGCQKFDEACGIGECVEDKCQCPDKYWGPGCQVYFEHPYQASFRAKLSADYAELFEAEEWERSVAYLIFVNPNRVKVGIWAAREDGGLDVFFSIFSEDYSDDEMTPERLSTWDATMEMMHLLKEDKMWSTGIEAFESVPPAVDMGFPILYTILGIMAALCACAVLGLFVKGGRSFASLKISLGNRHFPGTTNQTTSQPGFATGMLPTQAPQTWNAPMNTAGNPNAVFAGSA